MKRLFALCALIIMVFVVGFGQIANADVNDFVINSFSGDFSLSQNDSQGELRIIEHIDLTYSDNNNGITRAIPNSYKEKSLKLKINSVISSTGAPSQYSTYQDSGNTVLKIGDPNKTVTGNQKYTIDYTVQNVITFYDGYDELYWDINGDQWGQPFTKVTATFHMPDGIKINESKCFVGKFGNTEQQCVTTSTADGINIESLSILQPNETLTGLISIPKGHFAQPTKMDWWKENVGKVLAVVLPPLIIGSWAYRRWYKNGRDLKGRGTIIAEYEPPEGLGPAETGIILTYRLDAKYVSAIIVDLAIHKYLKIIETTKKKILKDSKEYSFQLLNDKWETLKPYEVEVLSGIFLTKTIDDEVELSALKGEFYKTVNKIKSSIPKALTSAEYFPINPSHAGGIMWGVIIALVIAGFVIHSWISLGFGLAAVLVAIFAALMPRRTAKGVEALDKIKGLKLYMNTAEKDRIAMSQSPNSPYADKSNMPKQTVELFEKLLPYAMVLGVENEWAKQFADIYTTPPDWYSGNWNTFNAIYLTNSLSNSVGSMSANFSPPSSSGSSGFSGGAGFSGGGGGGGGGGGW